MVSKAGNDLITPKKEFGFPGLKDGDSYVGVGTQDQLRRDMLAPSI